jgi:hypothetical protein
MAAGDKVKYNGPAQRLGVDEDIEIDGEFVEGDSDVEDVMLVDARVGNEIDPKHEETHTYVVKRPDFEAGQG